MEPVKGGNLVHLPQKAEKIFKQYSDDTNASWALQYALNLEHADIILSGMSKLEHVKNNINTAKKFKKLSGRTVIHNRQSKANPACHDRNTMHIL